MDKLTEYRSKVSWIKQLLSMNENRELNAVWKKYSILRKILESVESDLNQIQILETYTVFEKKRQYKIRLKRVGKELLRMTKETKA